MPRLLAVVGLLVLALPGFAGDPNVVGGWSGYWASDATGHRGPLRATIRPAGDAAYRATFRGRFAGVVPFRYAMTLDVVGGDGAATYLAGEQRLPLFGTFRYAATADGASFVATFSSRRDSGRFVMTRR